VYGKKVSPRARPCLQLYMAPTVSEQGDTERERKGSTRGKYHREGEHERYEEAARARRSSGGYTGAPRLMYVTKYICIYLYIRMYIPVYRYSHMVCLR